MEYRLTFEDGSDAYLTHHGVKGMHWGVWNAQTKMKYGDDKTPQRGGGTLSDEEVEELTEAENRKNEDMEALRFAKDLRGAKSDEDHISDSKGNSYSYRYEGGSLSKKILARKKKGKDTWDHLTALGVTSRYISDVSKVVNKKR